MQPLALASCAPARREATDARAPYRPLRAGLVLVAGLTALSPRGAAARQADSTEVCTEGRISEILVDSEDVFLIGDDSNVLARGFFGFMNTVHVNTRPSFIRSELLFREGDCLDPFLLQESERLIRNHRFIGPVEITSEDLPDGSKRVLVDSRDEWSTQVDLGVSYDQGFNVETLEVTEENFLGRGLFLSGEYRSYREREDITMRLLTQRFFGRADANIEYGSSRAGRFATQYITYPFVGEVGLNAFREFYQRRTEFFRYATDEAEPFTHVLLPVVDERLELSGARRFGRPGRYVMVGGSLIRDVYDFDPQELAFNGNFGEPVQDTSAQASEILRQVKPVGATRVAVHLASRRVVFREYRGLDALRGVRDVQLGADFGVTVGHSLGIFEPRDQRVAEDWLVRGRIQTGAPLGESLLLSSFMIESRHEGGDWRDVLAEADVFAYGRAPWLPYQTFFGRVSYAGGWATSLPFQLALGGRDGVRSLHDDRYPGGRSLIFTAEDRVFQGWPNWSAVDLGLTLFTDVGRAWHGDAPYGVDSPWRMALGVGLRIGLPSGTSNVMRWDLAFPVNGGNGPVFRITLFERHGLRHGFGDDLMRRSRRFDIGPEFFN